ncbi:helix-turn-helix domain-containing protein [Herbiconiux sp. CPCC 205763]|uniref:Helix-turn-helix domain-containing protein n=1 Tax=Herbiconiux aconitum TaxID=2970913 RepID=A0ABT2GMZ4_9MICO|nr:helix-turn-helix domain-containing protein [Herbiconiux aconitum]MCS5717598.1 helix-turn-helix domain-containing protein [Herbiconiux aconitum]
MKMADLKRRASIFAALSDPTRLGIVDLLTLGDLSSTDIQLTLGVKSNLVAHHIRVLEKAGVLSRSRSEFDRRRSYVRLQPEAFDALTPRALAVPDRVVFVCTANSARSQLAEAMWRAESEIPVASAGMQPAAAINAGAVDVAERHGIAIDPAKSPRLLSDVLAETDLVITVCDNAHERMGGRDDLHWSIPDPAPLGTPEAFERAFGLIAQRIKALSSRLVAPA